MRIPRASKLGLVVLLLACAGGLACPSNPTCPATPPTDPECPTPASPICQWGVGNNAPTAWPNSTQVMVMPTVMDLGSPAFGVSQIAFVSFETKNQIDRDGGGVLRIIDGNCHEVASFPNPNVPAPPLPPGCPTNLTTAPILASGSGLALGNIDTNPDVEIIGLLEDPGGTPQHAQVVAFNLVGPINAAQLIPKWCSQPLPAGDFISGPAAPAIAQLDNQNNAASLQSEIIVDNKVFDSTGALRYTGFSGGGNNCASMPGGSPCPRSRTVTVANLTGSPASLPQVITGRGTYRSVPASGPVWTGSPGWQNPNVGTNTAPSLVYPAVAELDPTKNGPEIVVTDTMATTLYVLDSGGAPLASIAIPNPGFNQCGGPPLVGDVHPLPGPEIGVASCSQYTLLKYHQPTGTLAVLWSVPTSDPGGQTTAALLNTPQGARIYYTDQKHLWVLNGADGSKLQCAPNTSATSIEGPTVASLGPGPQARVIVGANNYQSPCGQVGVRIFDTAFSGRACMNEHAYHLTNLTNCSGAIPTVEPLSWPSYRAQQ